jgi:hypothetical protein
VFKGCPTILKTKNTKQEACLSSKYGYAKSQKPLKLLQPKKRLKKNNKQKN